MSPHKNIRVISFAPYFREKKHFTRGIFSYIIGIGTYKRGSIMEKRHRLWTLFTSMLYISTFTFGGGFVIVSLMQKKFVEELHWLEEDEMLDMVALAQASPGAIAVNGAILVGRKLAGIPGIAVAVLGTILPPMVILSLISLAYEAFATNLWVARALKGMQAGVAAVIVDVSLNLGTRVVKERDPLCIALMIVAFVLNYALHVNVIYIILGAALLGIGKALYLRRKEAA